MGGIPIATSNKRTLKKFIHENAVTLVAAGLLIALLGILILSRFGALYSIKDIANINPLITSDDAKLVAVNVNGVIKIVKDDDPIVAEAESKSTKSTDKTSGAILSILPNVSGGSSSSVSPGTTGGGSTTSSTGGTTGGGGGTTTGGGGTSGGSTSGGGTTTGGGNTGGGGTSSPAPFRTSITSLTLTNTSQPYGRTGGGITGGIFTCKRDFTFNAQVKATSGSGEVNLTWSVDGTPKSTVKVRFDSAGQTQSLTYTTTTSIPGTHNLRAYISDAVQNTVNFTHKC